jgi:hypothetical protein
MFALKYLMGMMLLLSAGASPEPGSLGKQLVGRWKLVSTEQVLADGTRRPNPLYVPGAVAYLIYSSDGGMCAIFPAVVNGEERLNAYCGLYELNEAQGYVVHNVEIKAAPKEDQLRVDDMGAGLNRYVSVDGDALKLRIVEPRPSVKQDTQTWKRDD